MVHSASPRLDAELLLAHTVGKDRAWILAHPEAEVTPSQEAEYTERLRRRSIGVPLAYLLGRRQWYGLDLEVSPWVLIPRPETELLLERAVVLARQSGAMSLCDIGTGSGAIAIALALSLPSASVVATDISPEALKVAAANAHRLEVADRVTLLEGDLIAPVQSAPDVLVANLPYLSDERMTTIHPDVREEPVQALYGGSDGFDLYRRLARMLEARAWAPTLVIELDPEQVEMVARTFPGYSVTFERDYRHRDRIAVLTPKES